MEVEAEAHSEAMEVAAAIHQEVLEAEDTELLLEAHLQIMEALQGAHLEGMGAGVDHPEALEAEATELLLEDHLLVMEALPGDHQGVITEEPTISRLDLVINIRNQKNQSTLDTPIRTANFEANPRLNAWIQSAQ